MILFFKKYFNYITLTPYTRIIIQNKVQIVFFVNQSPKKKHFNQNIIVKDPTSK